MAVIILSILLISNINIDKVSAETLTNSGIDAESKIMTESNNFEVSGEQKSLLDYPNYLHNRFELDNKTNGN